MNMIESMDCGFELQLKTYPPKFNSGGLIITNGSFSEELSDKRKTSTKVRISHKIQYYAPQSESFWRAASKDDLWYNDDDYDQFENRYNTQMKKLAAIIDRKNLETKVGFAKRHGSPRRVQRQHE